MTPEQLSDLARQVGVVAVLLGFVFALHKEWIVLGREYRTEKNGRIAAERKAEEWQVVALRNLGLSERQVGISERAVSAAEQVVRQSPSGGP